MTESIPSVDIRALCDGKNSQAVADALLAASTDPGFIYISGHDIPDAVISTLQNHALSFFRRDEVDKNRVIISPKHRGWLPRGGAKMRDDFAADYKESFLWGYEDKNGDTTDDHPLRGANVWPRFMPELRGAAMAYYHHAERVAMQLLRGFCARVYGLDDEAFLRHCSRPLSRASAVYYPPQPDPR